MRRSLAYPRVFALSLLVFCLAIFGSLLIGSARIGVSELLAAALRGDGTAAGRILYHVRLPRTLASLLAGCALAASGVVIQSVLANPLAGPNLIGVNAGAGLAAVLCAAYLPALPWVLPTAAFIGALLAMLLIYTVARLTGASRITLVLAGIAVGSILSACIDSIVTMAPDALTSANAFRIGTVAGISVNRLFFPAIYILSAILLLFSFCSEMDVLALGDDTAAALGLNIKKYRFLLLLLAAMLAGAAVSFCGLLGFVGLIVPHAARFFCGAESKRLLPVALLMGGAFVTICDILARILFAPFELPVGIVMSFLGGPFFIWLLIRRKGGRSGND